MVYLVSRGLIGSTVIPWIQHKSKWSHSGQIGTTVNVPHNGLNARTVIQLVLLWSNKSHSGIVGPKWDHCGRTGPAVYLDLLIQQPVHANDSNGQACVTAITGPYMYSTCQQALLTQLFPVFKLVQVVQQI